MPQYRDQIKRCVKIYDFNILRQTLAEIDFTTTQGDTTVPPADPAPGAGSDEQPRRKRGGREPTEKRKEKLTIDDYKYIAFQFGQTLTLLRGQDLYTKTSVAQALPALAPFLRREREPILSTLHVLNSIRDELLHELRGVRVVAQGELNLFCLDDGDEPKGIACNQLHNQSRGTVVDALRGRVVCFPLTHFFNQGARWPTDDERHDKLFHERIVARFDWVTELVSVCAHNGQFLFVGSKGFDGPDVERVRSLVIERFGDVEPFAQQLDLEHYWYTFLAVAGPHREKEEKGEGNEEAEEPEVDSTRSSWELCLVGARHRYALSLQSPEQLADTARALGLLDPTTL
ncbi:uncharacterized protein ACA1_100110 [Acanthamoeba castellanii str. Neff]|uniref:Uncharacterized protein n=1 Tax=Acanthamoeba castellanii (strain ATCC 30010 / Neff) TaxID=1257118 RepID=L8GLW7_ACACF|nr:uncharacterized protein ACA1_100110 [Acanthamoeba castellanii str. Neff]ELR13196.1 hypothetical protein ACA1_100110 [Acanthamoeba castellanii str. Neff]